MRLVMTVPFRNEITNCRNGVINIKISLYIKYVKSALFNQRTSQAASMSDTSQASAQVSGSDTNAAARTHCSTDDINRSSLCLGTV